MSGQKVGRRADSAVFFFAEQAYVRNMARCELFGLWHSGNCSVQYSSTRWAVLQLHPHVKRQVCCFCCLICIHAVSEHVLFITQLHWPKTQEWIEFKLAITVCRYLHRTALLYLAEEFHQSSYVDAHQHLRSASTSSLVVRRSRLSTIGDRAFPVTASQLLNTLPPQNFTLALSLTFFRKHLKSYSLVVPSSNPV